MSPFVALVLVILPQARGDDALLTHVGLTTGHEIGGAYGALGHDVALEIFLLSLDFGGTSSPPQQLALFPLQQRS
jgi:hypothetical protein